MGNDKRVSWVLPIGMSMWLVAGMGCVGSANVSLSIGGNIAPDKQSMCTVAATNMLLLSGVYNVDSGRPYQVYPLYQNYLNTLGTRLSPPTTNVFIDRAEVELKAADGTPATFAGLPNPFTIPGGGTLVPSGATTGTMTTPGQQTGSLSIIPDAYRTQLPRSGVLVAYVRAFGKTAGNIKVETDPWQWTIQLCGGDPNSAQALAAGSVCLFRCADNADGNAKADLACNPGQDDSSTVLCLGG